jgi:hypothetical protein
MVNSTLVPVLGYFGSIMLQGCVLELLLTGQYPPHLWQGETITPRSYPDC